VKVKPFASRKHLLAVRYRLTDRQVDMAHDFQVTSVIKRISNICILFFLFCSLQARCQLDSVAMNLFDTLKAIIIDDAIPKKTFGDLFMYPHRWYVKQLLRPRLPYYDTNYIKSNKKKLNLSVAIAKKFYGFNFDDISLDQSLKFSPNNYYHIGFNCSNIILSFGFYPGIKFGAQPGKGTTKSRDIQLTVIGRRVITDINYQRYSGFYMFLAKKSEVNRIDASDVYLRPDINIFSFGANTMFVFNFKKYSLRGAFSFTDIQQRSAGSFMAGLYHSYLLFTSFDSTLVLSRLQENFSQQLYDINNISLITVGLTAGYGYTFVYRKFILSTAINAGGGGQKTNYETVDKKGHTLSLNPTLHLNIKSALRFDNMNYFAGVMANYVNNYTVNPRLFNTENFMGKVVLFAGYRFNLKRNGQKVLKALKLIDYD
jgi:hypothetical protein